MWSRKMNKKLQEWEHYEETEERTKVLYLINQTSLRIEGNT